MTCKGASKGARILHLKNRLNPSAIR